MKNAFIRDIRSIQQETVDRLESCSQKEPEASLEKWVDALRDLINAKQLCYQRYIQHTSLCRSLAAEPMEVLFNDFASQQLEDLQELKYCFDKLSASDADLSDDTTKIRMNLYAVSPGINQVVKENLTAERLSVVMISEFISTLDSKETPGDEADTLKRRLTDIIDRQEVRMNRLSDLLEF